MSGNNEDSIDKALSILRGRYEKPDAILALAKDLKKENKFGYARKLLNRALQDSAVEENKDLKLLIGQQHALCTYKDPDLPMSDRLTRAFNILNTADDLLKTKNHPLRWTQPTRTTRRDVSRQDEAQQERQN